MNLIKQNPEYYIATGALQFVENALDNPNRVAISMVSGTAILVHVAGQIDYGVDGNYRRWRLEAFNTLLSDPGEYSIYARLNRDDTNGLVVFSQKEYNTGGGIKLEEDQGGSESGSPEETTPEETPGEGEGEGAEGDGEENEDKYSDDSTLYYFVKIGTITSAESGRREITYDSGILSTDRGRDTSSLNEMFELDKTSVPWLIKVKQFFDSFTVAKALTVAGKFILGGKTVSRIRTSDGWYDEFGNPIPTTDDELITARAAQMMGEELYLSKVHDDTARGEITFKKKIILDGLEEEKPVLDEEGNPVMDDEGKPVTEKLPRVEASLKTHDFTSGEFGAGMSIQRYGDSQDTYMEIDRLLVRKMAYFVELCIKKLSHVGGTIILSPASMKASRVEAYSSSGMLISDPAQYSSAAWFRVYTETEDGVRKIQNEFRVNDLARTQTFNVTVGTSHNVGNSYYWRKVIAVADNGSWIDLSNRAGEKDAYDGDETSKHLDCTVPEAGDEIVACGNTSDRDRQNVLMLSAYGSDTPAIHFYSGVDTFSFAGKEVIFQGYDADIRRMIMKVFGDFYFGDRDESTYVKYSQDKGVEMVVRNLTIITSDGKKHSMAEFLDGYYDTVDENFVIWHADENYDPLESTWPSADWSAEEKLLHVGDFLVLPNGLVYRFTYKGGSFYWQLTSDRYLVDSIRRLDAIAADGIMSRDEKVSEKQEWEKEKAEYEQGISKAQVLEMHTTKRTEFRQAYDDYVAAFASLSDVMNAMFLDMTTDSELPNDYVSLWVSYMQKKTNFGLALGAFFSDQAIRNWAADGRITPSEKIPLKTEWDRIVQEKTELVGKCGLYGAFATGAVYNTHYREFLAAYDALDTYLNTTLKIFADMKAETSVEPTTFISMFDAYYEKSSVIKKDLADAAKGYVDADSDAAQLLTKIGKFLTGDKNSVNPGEILENGFLEQGVGETLLGRIGFTKKKDNDGNLISLTYGSGLDITKDFAQLFAAASNGDQTVLAKVKTFIDEVTMADGKVKLSSAVLVSGDNLYFDAESKAIFKAALIDFTGDDFQINAGRIKFTGQLLDLMASQINIKTEGMTQKMALDAYISSFYSGGAITAPNGVSGGASGTLSVADGTVLQWKNGVLTSASKS